MTPDERILCELAGDYSWIYRGLRCRIKTNSIGTFCGYAELPYATDEDVVQDINVHGGVTYGPDTIHEKTPRADDAVVYIGFDCAHAGDFIPRMPHTLRIEGDTKVWTVEDVIAETERMADQILLLQPKDAAYAQDATPPVHTQDEHTPRTPHDY